MGVARHIRGVHNLPKAVSAPTHVPVVYGLLYNWYAVTDSKNITASGWHVSTILEMHTLADYLGAAGNYSTNTVGVKLKEVGTTYWSSPNTGATNEVGFNGRGGASRRYDNGAFNILNATMRIWTSTEYSPTAACNGLLYYNLEYFSCNSSGGYPKIVGSSIRLVKDSTTLSHGETGTYTGNDGKVYDTICIGTQEWLAGNLCETKYRDNSTIPEVTDNSAWIALTTGALCAYNNDWDNAFI